MNLFRIDAIEDELFSLDFIGSLDAKGIQSVCQNTLHDFNLCMFSQPTGSAAAGPTLTHADGRPIEEKPNYLDDEMVFKIIVICLATIHLMQKDGESMVSERTCLRLRHRLANDILPAACCLFTARHDFINFIAYNVVR